MGPLANHRRIEMMEALVADARQKGARVLAGGSRIGNRGYYFPLTVLADLPDDARAMHEEPFGPMALINPVKSLDEAIEKANSLPYGLAAYAFTRSARNADRLADGVEAGNLSINNFVASIAETPFGGVKESGYGREGGTEGLLALHGGEERIAPHDVGPAPRFIRIFKLLDQPARSCAFAWHGLLAHVELGTNADGLDPQVGRAVARLKKIGSKN